MVAACVLLLFAMGCGESPRDRPLNEPGERLYTLKGHIEARDVADNVIRVKHEAIPGFMEAMTMDFTVRGADVAALPPDGTLIEAQLHVTERAYWLTGVTSPVKSP